MNNFMLDKHRENWIKRVQLDYAKRRHCPTRYPKNRESEREIIATLTITAMLIIVGLSMLTQPMAG
jgi:hypothetical protein